MDIGVSIGVGVMFGLMVMVICIVWCNIRRSVKRPLGRTQRISFQGETSLGMIYALTLQNTRPSPYLSNSVTEHTRRHEKGLAQQKELQKTNITGLPSYEEITSTYRTDPSDTRINDMPPPYSLI